jgi:hypothetical protein
MVVEEEYRIQTPESASWDAEFKKNFNRIVNDDGRIASERSDLLRAECADLKNLKVIHGNSKVPRKIDLFTGAETPIPTGQGVPVWVRDGWTVDEKSIVAEAQKAGTDSPLVFVYIPRRSADDLKKTVASLKAAEETLNIKGTPTTPGGLEARAAIETRKSVAEIKLKGIVTEIVNGTQVFMAGGNEIAGIFMQDRVEEAAKNALTRLYPQFDVADDPRWEKVVERAKKGDSSALEALGFKGDPDKHPVCAAILGFVNAGKKGSEIRKQFSSGQFGWPRTRLTVPWCCSRWPDTCASPRMGSFSIRANSTTRRSASAISAPNTSPYPPPRSWPFVSCFKLPMLAASRVRRPRSRLNSS